MTSVEAALNAAGLEAACQSFNAITGEHVDKHIGEAIEDAIRAYLAASPPYTGARLNAKKPAQPKPGGTYK